MNKKELSDFNEKFYNALNNLLEEMDRCDKKNIPFMSLNRVYLDAVEILLQYEESTGRES